MVPPIRSAPCTVVRTNGIRKLLIFSYFRDGVDLAADLAGQDAAMVRGGVRQNIRGQLIDAFDQADGFAALSMQVETGGEGLNLQSASVVVLLEPRIKPSMEIQAVGRAYRSGQIKPVVVHRLIALNSVDEGIVELSRFKAELFDQLARRSPLADALRASREVDPEELLPNGSDDGDDFRDEDGRPPRPR